jgi:hypothetical protein
LNAQKTSLSRQQFYDRVWSTAGASIGVGYLIPLVYFA